MQKLLTEKKINGYIYCLSNPTMPGLLKIGMTTRTPEERAKELFTTGVAAEFKVEFERRIVNPLEKEKAIHKLLDKYRYNSNREYFNISAENAMKIIDTQIIEDIQSSSPSFLSIENIIQEAKNYYETLSGIEKEKFFNDVFPILEKMTKNTTIN